VSADADFFFDPVCPWAWITSRWVHEVASQRPLDVQWRCIALRIVNEQRDYDKEFPPGYVAGHDAGLHLLRVAAALREAEGNEAVGRYYTAIGTKIHVEGGREGIREEGGVAALLATVDLPDGARAAADDPSWDDAVRADTETALQRVGKDVGTPILTFAPPDGPSFFGPVISRIPRGTEAVDLWESVEHIARFPGFAELKRSLRERPQTS
jgi:2-hydroxychromene-2-carboxylate isomerase